MSGKEIGLAEFLLMWRSALEVRRERVESLEELTEAEAGLARVGSERRARAGGS